MEKQKIVDEKAIECAEILKEYCKSYKSCSEGCVFYKGTLYCGCKLDDDAEKWKLNEDDGNE